MWGTEIETMYLGLHTGNGCDTKPKAKGGTLDRHTRSTIDGNAVMFSACLKLRALDAQ